MNKLQNLKKNLKEDHREAKDINLFRESIKKALLERKYSWFELYYDQDKSYRGFVEAVEEYRWKPMVEDFMIGAENRGDEGYRGVRQEVIESKVDILPYSDLSNDYLNNFIP